jgi:hypothetical protein
MGWVVVDSGATASGLEFQVERHVVDLPVPKSMSTLPIRLRSYRCTVRQADGSKVVFGKAKSKSEAISRMA